jgi:multiple antibiotic resistance protein
MTEHINFGLLVFTSFFTLINPLGVMPVFMTMTSELTPQARTYTATKATIIAYLTLVAFAFSGQLLFDFFGISVNSFRVVGGIIFFLMGQDMLQARLASSKISEAEIKTYVNDISVTPLAIPMITGPGAITNMIVLWEDAATIDKKAILLTVVGIIFLITFIVLWSSSRIIKILGDTGNKVMMRLMGLIMMVIAVEFFWSGFKPMVINLLQEVIVIKNT